MNHWIFSEARLFGSGNTSNQSTASPRSLTSAIGLSIVNQSLKNQWGSNVSLIFIFIKCSKMIAVSMFELLNISESFSLLVILCEMSDEITWNAVTAILITLACSVVLSESLWRVYKGTALKFPESKLREILLCFLWISICCKANTSLSKSQSDSPSISYIQLRLIIIIHDFQR